MTDLWSNQSFVVQNDSFSIVVDGFPAPLSPASMTFASAQQQGNSVIAAYTGQGGVKASVNYTLGPSRRFLTKTAAVTGIAGRIVRSVELFRASVSGCIWSGNKFSFGNCTLCDNGPGGSNAGFGPIAGFLRCAPAEKPAADSRVGPPGVFFSITNPYAGLAASFQSAGSPGSLSSNVTAMYPEANHATRLRNGTANFIGMAGDAFVSDPLVLGTYSQSASHEIIKGSGIDVAERDAFVECVRAFFPPAPAKAVRLNVDWDENVFQIDLGLHGRTSKGNESVAEYKRIISRNAELGIKHMVFSPTDSDVSNINTDGWHWEHILWLTFGAGVRNGTFAADLSKIQPPAPMQTLFDYAKSKGVKLMAYVYPTLAFASAPGKSEVWQYGEPKANGYKKTMGCPGYMTKNGPQYRQCNADMSNRDFQDYLLDLLSRFVKRFDLGGFAFDYGISDGLDRVGDGRLAGGQVNPNASRYAIWHGWMRIMHGLRAEFPDIVLDHRESAHLYGPWHQIAGSYAEPIGGDENPETFGIMPNTTSTHTDHVTADYMRAVNYWYKQKMMLPTERVPGFAFHQSDRNKGQDPSCDCFRRDFDLVGYKYSLVSQVATAGLNHNFAFVPARDPEESALLPKEDIAFVNQWLNFSDDNYAYLQRTVALPGMDSVRGGTIDGTAAFLRPPSCATTEDWAEEGGDNSKAVGYVFLFNPGYRQQNASFVLDNRLSPAGDECLYQRFPARPSPAAAGAGAAAPSFVIEELYPLPRALSTVALGAEVTVPMDGSSAVVLRLSRASSALAPILLGAQGSVSIGNAGGIAIHGLRGEPGTSRRLSVLLPPSVACSKLQLGGVLGLGRSASTAAECLSERLADLGVVRFGGDYFPHARQLPLSCHGGKCRGDFTVPAAIAAQLAKRNASYSISWQPFDEDASWLNPARLLLFLQMPSAQPMSSHPPQPGASANYTAVLTLDGAPLPTLSSYQSRYANPQLFNGHYWDVTAAAQTPGARHEVLLEVPANVSASMVGLFFENVEPQLAAATEAIEQWAPPSS